MIFKNYPEKKVKSPAELKEYFKKVDRRISLIAKCTGCGISGKCLICNPCSECEIGKELYQ